MSIFNGYYYLFYLTDNTELDAQIPAQVSLG